MPGSPAQSLFASDYSVSGPGSPSSPRITPPRPTSSPSRSATRNIPSLNLNAPSSPSPLRQKQGLGVAFPPSGLGLPTPLISPLGGPNTPQTADDIFAALPKGPSCRKGSVAAITPLTDEFSDRKRTQRLGSKSSGASGYDDFDGCMEGGLGHETKAGTYNIGTEKAYHHLNRANDLFSYALSFRPNNARALLARSKILITLAMNYQNPKVAIKSLTLAIDLLRQIRKLAPRSVSARETLAQACSLLSATMLESDDTADEEQKVWDGLIGRLAREALQNLEDVAADKMDKMRDMHQEDAALEAPGMAETFIALSAAAVTVSSMATSLPTIDVHIELAEQALDQASNMATVAAAARIKSSTASANLITRVQLASGKSSLERLRHTFTLGTELDEDDFRSLLSDMAVLAGECRERAAKLKGSKAAAASTLAWEAIKQLGDAKLLYASLLRLVWRKRRPNRKGSDKGRKLSQRSDKAGEPIKEEPEEEEPGTEWAPTLDYDSRKAEESAATSGARPGNSRKDSGLEVLAEEKEVESFSSQPLRYVRAESLALPMPGRRGSWLPSGGDQIVGRSRRMSSMSGPLTGPDGISAWNRKASIISLGAEDEAVGLVPSTELTQSAWQLLEGGVKQYKLALTLLSTSDLPAAQLQRAKTDTLTSIAHCSMFMASLARRLPIAMEKRTSLLVTAEVYATWAAREVGWSFLIEGTKEAQLADRRTNSWRADESGKRAVMLLLRIWWHRAVTTESIDVETKSAAKDAVEVVVRRMKDREGVKDGDVARWKKLVGLMEGEMDAAETLFWRSVSRILRGGAGFVMS